MTSVSKLVALAGLLKTTRPTLMSVTVRAVTKSIPGRQAGQSSARTLNNRAGRATQRRNMMGISRFRTVPPSIHPMTASNR